jgi:transcription factor TGA
VIFFLFVLKNKNFVGSMFCLKSGNVTVVSHNLPYATALNTVQYTFHHPHPPLSFAEHITCWYLLINAANVFCFCFYNLLKSTGSAEIATTGAGCLDTGQYVYQKGTGFDSSLGNGQTFENWGDSGMADNSLQTDTSTDVNTDDKNKVFLSLSLLICYFALFSCCFIYAVYFIWFLKMGIFL